MENGSEKIQHEIAEMESIEGCEGDGMNEQRAILKKISAETLRDMVTDLGNALAGYKESFAIVTEELEKWKNGSKVQADKIAELEAKVLELSQWNTTVAE